MRFQARFPAAKRSTSRLATDNAGATAVEFSLLAPVLFLVLLAIIQFGVALNNYVELTDAVRVGARQFAISSASTTPMSSATNLVDSSAASLTGGSISLTFKVNGAACTGDAACQTALASAAGGTATVAATYPCDLTVMGINFAPGCTLSAQTADMVE